MAIGVPVLLLLFCGWLYLGYRSFSNEMANANKRLNKATIAALAPAGNILTNPQISMIMGSDSRGSNAIAGARSDSILLVRTNPSEHLISMLSIPRDLDVPIPGHGTNKINAAFAYGGPPLLIHTVNRLTGLGINHVVLVDFSGFRDLIDSLGGVTVDNPTKVVSSQPFDGLIWHFAKGTIHLDGRHALAYARIRHTTNPADTDITRTERQQRVVQALMHQLVDPLERLQPADHRPRPRPSADHRHVGARDPGDGLDQVPGVAHARVPPRRHARIDRRPGRAAAERAERRGRADVPGQAGTAAGGQGPAVRPGLHRPLGAAHESRPAPREGVRPRSAARYLRVLTRAGPEPRAELSDHRRHDR